MLSAKEFAAYLGVTEYKILNDTPEDVSIGYTTKNGKPIVAGLTKNEETWWRNREK